VKQIIKRFGQPESDEARAVRLLVQTPGYAQAVEKVEYVDVDGNVVRYKTGPSVPPRRAVAERFTLTDEGAAKHDEILDNIGAGLL